MARPRRGGAAGVKAAPTRPQLERFRHIITARLGLRLDDDKLPLLTTVLSERVAALGNDAASYLLAIGSPHERDELRVLAERLTIGETYFFRNANDLQAFLAVVVPERFRQRGADRRLRILSIGCSSGEEPYTLSMLLRDLPEVAAWDVDIRGVDVNPAAISRASRGRYTAWALRQTPPEMRSRFFRAEHGGFRVADDVRERVSFEERNVIEDDAAFWTPDTYDVVFCRNILMYFVPEVTRDVVARIEATLAPGGFLFLGHAETLRGVSSAFHLLHSHGTFYYQLKEGGAPALDPVRTSWTVPAAQEPQDVTWIEAVRQASERVAALTAAASSPAPPVAIAPGASLAPVIDAPWARVTRALDLLRHERHADALDALGGATPDEDTDALLLRAVLLTSSGDVGASEQVCARLLQKDELNAEAHYVMALCREHAGDRVGAANHDHYALYLDEGFAMPRLHLGLLAKRSGDLPAARKELARALVLLAAEEASRILLLGGGFSRDALVDLCRAELRACGEGA